MNKEELLIFNNGERLIPGVSHGREEYIRHKSSYDFFIKLIKADSSGQDISILDLGCGVGWGCKLLVDCIPNARITGLDNFSNVLSYAKKNYSHFRIDYGFIDLSNKQQLSFLNNFSYDYIVSRGVLEHINKGLGLVKNINYNKMLIFDVPYNEIEGNPHHKINNITEDNFKDWNNIKFYYESFNGGIITETKQKDTNMLMCVCRR
ncbi:MAG: class I SAM-dependent methyltransferase [Patescibacteria group bacterium]